MHRRSVAAAAAAALPRPTTYQPYCCINMQPAPGIAHPCAPACGASRGLRAEPGGRLRATRGERVLLGGGDATLLSIYGYNIMSSNEGAGTSNEGAGTSNEGAGTSTFAPWASMSAFRAPTPPPSAVWGRGRSASSASSSVRLLSILVHPPPQHPSREPGSLCALRRGGRPGGDHRGRPAMKTAVYIYVYIIIMLVY